MKKASDKKNEITINDLAVMMTAGFRDVDARLDKKIGDLAVAIGKVDKKTDDLTTLVDGLAVMTAKRFNGVEDRLEKVEHDVVATKLSVLNLGDRSIHRYEFAELRVRFNRLEQKVEGKTKK